MTDETKPITAEDVKRMAELALALESTTRTLDDEELDALAGILERVGRRLAGVVVRKTCEAKGPQPPRRDSACYGECNGRPSMSKLLRGVAAGYGAKKLGGGCFSTILIFILLWWLLGNFGMFQ